MSTFDADVIVAGAGLAGATFALAAASGGLDVIVVDPAPFSTQLDASFDGRASAIAWACFRQWQALGMGEDLAKVAQPIQRILVTDGKRPGAASGPGHAVFLRFDAEEITDRSDGEPMGWMVENRQSRAALSRALERSTVELRTPVGLTGLESDAFGATVILSDGSRLRAPLVVGAEGRASRVREASGIGVVGWPYPRSGVVATVKLERPHEGVAHEVFLPDGALAILPLTDQRASLVWTEPHDRAKALKAASLEAFTAHLSRRFGEFLGEVEVLEPRFVYPLSLLLADSLIGPRVALVGDAGHGIHPLAGQGLNLGLKDAAALAETLVDARRLGEDIGSPSVLARYQGWRRFDNVTMALMMEAFDRTFATDNPLIRAVRDSGMATVNAIPAARRFFMAEAGGAVGDLPRLLKGEAL